jgi:hypothetical protein
MKDDPTPNTTSVAGVRNLLSSYLRGKTGLVPLIRDKY